MENLIVTSSPHIHNKATTRKIMLDVVIALLPATVAAVLLFGLRALLLICTCVVACVASEFVFNLCIKKKQTVGDFSAVVTGLLLALNLSSNVTIWQCIVGSVFAIVIVKCVFGGIGCNFANPAMTARVFMVICFSQVAGGAMPKSAEIVAGPTPLDTISSSTGTLPSLFDMLIGNRGGAIGETCAIALIIGFVYLLCRKVISWHTPVVFIGTVFLFTLIIKQDLITAVYAVLAGGLLLGAIFMATDYVTTPTTIPGKMLFGFGCGIITVLIRYWGTYPEGVSFSILFMNILTPYINKVSIPKVVGGVKNEK